MQAHDRMCRGATVLGDARFAGRREWDAFICALGYERRARFVAERMAAQANDRLAIQFPHHQIFDFEENRRLFEQKGFSIVNYDPGTLQDELDVFLKEVDAKSSDGTLNICLDISSMSRPMLAMIVWQLSNSFVKDKFRVTFTYAPAKYSADIRNPGPVSYAAPVLPEFAGWSVYPDAPLAAIVGLGCEDDYAMGALERLEAAATRIFIPAGESKQYEIVVKEANKSLLDSLEQSQIFEYNINRPNLCFQALDRLVHSFCYDWRTIILPFGPKIFALLSLLAGLNYYPQVTIWRVSGAQMSIPINRYPSGKIIGIEVVFDIRSKRRLASEVHRSALREGDTRQLTSLG